ncbi:MAG: hypothetical protein QOG53_797 [Frankiales bacterium]|jgi:hypothetical protein|nr:hypothetical protein [Frankiales bacterium]
MDLAVSPKPQFASELEGIEDCPPGPETLARLLAVEPTTLSEDDKTAAAIAWEKLIRQATGGQLQILGSMLHRSTDDPAAGTFACPDWAQEEITAALMISPAAAQQRLWLARKLSRRLPRTLRLLCEGRLNYLHARALVESTEVLDDDAAAQVEARVLLRAPEQTSRQFSRSLRRAVMAADPAAAQKRRQKGVRERRVERWFQEDGLAALYMSGPAEDIDAIYDCATELAHHDQRNGSTEGVDALRFDNIKDAVIGAFVNGKRPTHQGMPVALQILGAATTVAGLDDQPGQLIGAGPIPASVLRALAGWPNGLGDPEGDGVPNDTGEVDAGLHDAQERATTLTVDRRASTWAVLAVDDAGRLVPSPGEKLDLGRFRYAPDAALRRYLRLRDVRCTFPGCSQPAERCDLDHAHPWDDGGTTCKCNMHAVCRRHHRAKTVGGWKVIPHEDESRTWVSPLGREYLVRPPDLLDC